MIFKQWMAKYSEWKISRNCHNPHAFEIAKQNILDTGDLTEKEKKLLNIISLLVHRNDDMFCNNAQHYLNVGLGAVRCLENVLQHSFAEKKIRSILDFPCGYGRELRFLKCRFPDADISGVEIIPAALEFCKTVFSIKTFSSTKNFINVQFPEKYDLIWCGSLITHKDDTAIRNLLKLFHYHLLPDGLCVFTAQGRTAVELIKTNRFTYGLPKTKLDKLLAQFDEKEFGYVDYDSQLDYGISLSSHDYMTSMAQNAGTWKETLFQEHGWDNHQDVYAFKK